MQEECVSEKRDCSMSVMARATSQLFNFFCSYKENQILKMNCLLIKLLQPFLDMLKLTTLKGTD